MESHHQLSQRSINSLDFNQILENQFGPNRNTAGLAGVGSILLFQTVGYSSAGKTGPSEGLSFVS